MYDFICLIGLNTAALAALCIWCKRSLTFPQHRGRNDDDDDDDDDDDTNRSAARIC